MNLLEVDGLTLRAGDFEVCTNAQFRCERSQIWGVLGPNGSGKTTLLHALAALIQPESGTIQLDGQSLKDYGARELARRVGLLSQNNAAAFPDRVLDVCLSGLHPHLGRFQWESADEYDTAISLLNEVGLAGYEERWVGSLSGGEMQRLMLAVLLAQNPDVWLLDEPSNHLDLKYQLRLLKLVRERIARVNGLGLLVLHDVNLAARFCTHLMLLDGDGGLESGTVGQLLEAKRLSRLYGLDLSAVKTPEGTFFHPV
ncbi:MAG: ABC transporter ATP-binding protein [Gammaproteobacteria bacterium]